MSKAVDTLDHVMYQKMSVERSLEISLDVMKGVQQMHTLPMGPVAHGDIKSTQFLIDEQGTILLADLHKMHYTGHSNIKKHKMQIY